ncbi:MAG: cytochrome c [Candidatus Polarisedimenticolaceae bacterium]|nr:cytochrome c [Candidatus Polarisedimenticolaceae bacterium]
MKLISLTFYILAIAFSGAAYASDHFSGFGSDNDEGARTYSMQCAGCHGESAGGRSGMAPNFSQEWFRLTKSNGELARNLRNGFKTPGKFYTGGTCPSTQLTDDEIDEILAHMRQLVGQ